MPMDVEKYPKNWKEISYEIRFVRAKGKCEGSPTFPNCIAKHRQAHPITGSKVILTVAHLDHNPLNNHPSNLRAMCQRCHLTYDAKYRARNAIQKTLYRLNLCRYKIAEFAEYLGQNSLILQITVLNNGVKNAPEQIDIMSKQKKARSFKLICDVNLTM